MELLKQMVPNPFIPPCHQNFLVAVMAPCQSLPRSDLVPWAPGEMSDIAVSMFPWPEDRLLPLWSGLLTICLKGADVSGSHLYTHTNGRQRPSLPEVIPSLTIDSSMQGMEARKSLSNQELLQRKLRPSMLPGKICHKLLDSSGKYRRLSQSTGVPHDWQKAASASA